MMSVCFRLSISSNNNVIGDIKKSLRSTQTKEEADFWWFSNGITLLASSALIVGKEISLENVQIVNGLQTTYTIYEHFSEAEQKRDDRSILIKIIVTENEDIRSRIIKATNYQNAVDLDSLRATDKIQKDIEQFFERYTWYYDRRKNYYKNQGRPAERIVSVSYLGAAVRAFALRNPTSRLQDRTRWMRNDDQYSTIFNAAWDLRVFLICLEIAKSIETILRNMVDVNEMQFHITNKQIKYAIGLLYIAKLLRDTNYTPEQITSIKTYPDKAAVDQIVGHFLACMDEETLSEWRLDIIMTNRFLNFALRELEKNAFTYLTYPLPADSKLTPRPASPLLKVREHLRLASECEREKRFDEALRNLEVCLKRPLLPQKQAAIHGHMGRILARSGQFAQAIEHYEQALTLGLSTSEFFAGYATALYKAEGDIEKIEQYFLEALRVDETYGNACDAYATFLDSMGRTQEAEHYARRAVELSPDTAYFLNNLALILEKKGEHHNLVEASELLERAIALAREGFDQPKQNLERVRAILRTSR